jgi:molybdopterin molybdotransferase
MIASELSVEAPVSWVPAAGGHDPAWPEARQLAFEAATPLPPVRVPLDGAAGRVLTGPVTAMQDLPHYASAAMDGWAVNGSGPWLLVETGQPLAPGRACVIATGGLVPGGADAVLRKESGAVVDDYAGKPTLSLRADAKPGEPMPGQHIRPAGTEAPAGEALIPAGTVLNPAHIALAAVAGHDHLEVQAKPVVAVVLTGSEVVTEGVPGPGQVRDTFGPQLGTVISSLGGTPGDFRRIGDSFDAWLDALRDTGASGSRADVVITTGGTGKSGTDHFRDAVAALGGRLLLDGIAMRPGHPAVLAELADGRFVVGLPGNPLAAMMALTTIGAPLLAGLANEPLQKVEYVTSGSDVAPDGGCGAGSAAGAGKGRTRLIPCRFLSGLAFPVGHTGPGMMRGLAWADGVMAVPPGGVDSGESVAVLPLPWTQGRVPTHSAGNPGRTTPWHA